MRKVLAILVVLIFASMAVGWSQQVFYGPTPTAAWDADDNDSAIYTFIEYETGLMDSVTGEVFIGVRTTALQHTWDISNFDNDMYLGVRSRLSLPDGTPIDSPWNWSHENGALTPNPFVCRRSLPDAHAPPNLRLIQP